MPGPTYTLNVSAITIKQIVIAGNKKHLAEPLRQALNSANTVIQSKDIDSSTIIVPVA
jgi:hypothetical protein